MKEVLFKSDGSGIPLLTQRGVLLLLAGGLVPIIGLGAGVSAKGVSVGLLAFLLLLLGIFTRELRRYRALRKGLATSLILPPVMYSGSRAQVGIAAVSGGRNAEPYELQVRVVQPPGVHCSLDAITLNLVGSQPKTSGACTLTALERGVKEWKQIVFRVRSSGSLLGFQWNAFSVAPATVMCLPNHVASKMHQTSLRSSVPYGERVGNATVPSGREFYALREYAVGDDPRRIEWKRSARGDSLFVKEFRPETHQRVAIAIDCGNTMSTAADGRVLLEYAADAASVLCAMASYWQDEVALLGFNHLQQQRTPFGKGKLHHQRLTQAITDLRVGDLESDYGILSSWANSLSRRSLLVVISGMSSGSRIEQLKPFLRSAQRRHLPLLLFMEDRDIRKIAEAGASSLDDAFRSAAAIYQREELLRQVGMLKNSGISTLYVEPRQVAFQLERTYHQFKLSGML